MKPDTINKYLSLREELTREKEDLEKRLRRICEVLAQPLPGASQPRGRGRPPGGAGALSLRAAVLQAIGKRAMKKEEVLDEVQRLGYRFTTSNPLNSLGTILYGKKPRFKNSGGYFSLDDGASDGSAAGTAAPVPTPAEDEAALARKRRQMTPEARQRIAAAQRERWARQRVSA